MKHFEKPTHMLANQELVEKCKNGDSRAQMEIYKLYYKAMFNTSLYITGNEADAEDIMQEAFLKAFRMLPHTDLQSGFGGWLKKIVVNKSLDLVRSRKVHFEDIDNLRYDEAEDQFVESQEEALADQVQRVRAAMEKLPEKYRVILTLNWFEGYDHDEIGDILGIPASTSRAQVSRGKKKLMELLSLN